MKKAILILLFILITAHPCFARENAKREVKKGNLLYDEGKFKESLAHYEKAASAEPNSGIVNHNIGAAAYKLNGYEKAVNFFNRALTDEEKKEELNQQTSYNLANSEYMLGISKENSDLQEAINLLTRSLRHYEKALELDKEDKDAIFNYEYVKKELKRLKEKLKQQQQKEQQKQDQKQDQQQDKEQQKQDQQQRQQDKEQEKQEQQQGEDQDQQQEDQQQQKEQEKQGQQQDRQEDKQQKEKEGKEGQKPQDQEAQESDRGRNVRGSAESSANGPQEEISAKQASMLLDNYRHDEEPKGLYKQKIRTQGLPDVDKDW